MNASRIERLIDWSLEQYGRGRQDPESTVLDIVHAIVGEESLAGLSYFLEVAPREMVKAGAERMTRLKNHCDFMIPPFFMKTHSMPKEEVERITLERKALYEEIHEALKREAAR